MQQTVRLFFDRRRGGVRRCRVTGRTFTAFADDPGAPAAARQQLLDDLAAVGVKITGELPDAALADMLAALQKNGVTPEAARQPAKMSEARRRQLLSDCPVGRKILADERKAARAAGRRA